MRLITIAALSFATAACSSTPHEFAETSVRREIAAFDVPSADRWYAEHSPESHYYRAIADDDRNRFASWFALGLPADFKASPAYPTAFQEALAAHRREMVATMIENPVVSLRPDLRRPIELCPTREDHLTVRPYDFLVFEDANLAYERSCKAEDYYLARERLESDLVVTPFVLEMFLAIAGNEPSNPAFFRNDTRLIRRALRAAKLTKDRDSPNARMLAFIEKF